MYVSFAFRTIMALPCPTPWKVNLPHPPTTGTETRARCPRVRGCKGRARINPFRALILLPRRRRKGRWPTWRTERPPVRKELNNQNNPTKLVLSSLTILTTKFAFHGSSAWLACAFGEHFRVTVQPFKELFPSLFESCASSYYYYCFYHLFV